MNINAHAENLRALFFPSEECLGFYSTFEVSDRAVVIDPGGTVGGLLLGRLGLTTQNGKIGFEEWGGNFYKVMPYLWRLGDAIWAGYWDGDGVAITGRISDITWGINTDIKCDYYWREIPNPLSDDISTAEILRRGNHDSIN